MASRLPYVWDYDIDEAQFRDILAGRVALGRLDRGWAAVRLPGIFPVDLARILLSVTRTDWEQNRWVEAPTAEQFVTDLQVLGESLILVE